MTPFFYRKNIYLSIFRHKIVIAGNHEITFDLREEKQLSQRFFGPHDNLPEEGFISVKSILTSCPDLIYLEDSSVTIQGVKFWGSPHQPWFHDWAFNRTEEERAYLTSKIPEDVDVLLSHGPPYQILDYVVDGSNVGCVFLQEEIFNRIKPKLVVFGHIHEDYGQEIIDGINFVNACTCNFRYKPVNVPICVDIPCVVQEDYEGELD